MVKHRLFEGSCQPTASVLSRYACEVETCVEKPTVVLRINCYLATSKYSPGLSSNGPRDRAVVDRFSTLHSQERTSNRVFVDEAFHRSCDVHILGSAFSPQNVYAFIMDMASAREEETARMNRLYHEFSNSLSDEGRSTLDATVSKEIAPGVRQTEVDLAWLAIAANEHPEISAPLFKHFQRLCDGGSLFDDKPAEPLWSESTGNALGTN